jgi:hypothetical protein
MSLLLFAQYTLYLINLSAKSSVREFPAFLKGTLYANSLIQSDFLPFEYRIMYGLGEQRSQLTDLHWDFIMLYAASMYIYYFGNPILRVEKIFWSFPFLHDDPKNFGRLNNNIAK